MVWPLIHDTSATQARVMEAQPGAINLAFVVLSTGPRTPIIM